MCPKGLELSTILGMILMLYQTGEFADVVYVREENRHALLRGLSVIGVLGAEPGGVLRAQGR